MRVSLRARIDLAGSPTDACEGAQATLTAAIEARGGAEIVDGAMTGGELIDTASTGLSRHVPERAG